MVDRASAADDLMGREVATMFDKDANGMGESWAGDAGRKSSRMRQFKFKSHGLSET